MKRLLFKLAIAAVFVFPTLAASQETPPPSGFSQEDWAKIEKVEKALTASMKLYESIYSYSSTIIIRERINGKMRPDEYIKTYFLRPKKVYLEWVKPYEGLKLTYIPERDGKDYFQVKEAGFRGIFGVFKWPNNSQLIDTFYPHRFRAYQTNFNYVFDLATRDWNRGKKINKIKVREITSFNDPVNGRMALKVDVDFSPNPADGMTFGRVTFYFDQKTGLPLRFDLYDHDGQLWGNYAFTEFTPNIKIDPAIFELTTE
jgi:outer membrane lipoprotein-sorting protein